MQQRVSNGIKCNYYSATEFAIVPLQIDVIPDYEVVSESTSTSTIHRLTDTVHIRAKQSRQRTWAGSLNWNAMI